jgi:hypothetical protein
MTYLLFLSAFSLSSIAAYYAIMGLMAIFSGAAVSIAIMGVALEVSKLVVTSWLYRNWESTSLLLKSYFLIAIVVLMSLTSMGIFGFLSKAHGDQSLVVGEAQYKLAAIDEKIKFHKDIINESRRTLNQLDLQVTETISRTGGSSAANSSTASSGSGDSGINRSIAIRRSQAKERADLAKSTSASQEELTKLSEGRAPYASEVRQVEAEVGPIKYIAKLIYGEQAEETSFLEKAVRIVILMIVGVFDPLAVLMFIALNQTIAKKEQEKVVAEPTLVPSIEPPTPEVEEEPVVESVQPVPKNHLKMAESITPADEFKIEKI